MKEKGLLFSTDMVKALLDEKKTQTRRLINVPSDYTWGGFVSDSTNGKEDGMDKHECTTLTDKME
jgi:hypothetical protein